MQTHKLTRIATAQAAWPASTRIGKQWLTKSQRSMHTCECSAALVGAEKRTLAQQHWSAPRNAPFLSSTGRRRRRHSSALVGAAEGTPQHWSAPRKALLSTGRR
jgi:hypothetical protein